MKRALVISFWLIFGSVMIAQSHDGDGYNHPDSLELVTVSGSVIINESTLNPVYFLDENNDGIADYHLNFGPHWYEPDSSNAVRPGSGDNITITGGLNDSSLMTYPVIIVYEINGEFWRDPYFASWNNIGIHNHYMGDHHNGERGQYGFGWEHDTLETLIIDGVVLSDTTFYMNHYYLDSDNDALPDYTLNFGPPWYEPESGIERPHYGDRVNIVGGVMNSENEIPVIIVFEINGEVWRDSSLIGSHFGGGWISGSMSGSRKFHSPFDSEDHMIISEGWRDNSGHGHGGNMMPDSLFTQMLEIYPENIPLAQQMNVVAAYEIHMFQPDGSSGMRGPGGMGGGHMTFGSEVQFQLHYNDNQLNNINADEESITVKYWDDESEQWITPDYFLNTQKKVVTFNSSEISNYVIITADKATGIISSISNIPSKFSLSQNYPNPFNPSTTIEFQVILDSHVILYVYNVLGEKVAELVNRQLGSGKYKVDFFASELHSGIYFYRLITNDGNITKRMILIK